MQIKRRAAYAAIYLLWGGSYLAIRQVVHVVPPFLAASARYSISGTILLVFSFAIRREAPPSMRRILNCMATGIAMTALGYSIVFWAATRLPSWTVAVLTATSFLWTYIGECLVLRSERPRLRMFFFLLMGLAGIPLVGGTALQRGHSISSFAAVSVVAGALSWSASSLAIKRIRLPESCWQTAGFQLATAGILLAGVSRALGEWTRVPEMNITLGYQPLLGMTYLIFGGSVIAFGSFHWLMRRESPSLVATFAYANPIVAMALGIGFAGESCSVRQLIGAIAILLSVVLIWKTQPARVSVSMAKDRTDASSGGEARLNGFSETVA